MFLPCGFFLLLLSSFFSSPNLSCRRLDVCHTSTHGVAIVQIQNAGLKCTACGSLEMQDAKKCIQLFSFGVILCSIWPNTNTLFGLIRDEQNTVQVSVVAKFHYAVWSQTGLKLVTDLQRAEIWPIIYYELQVCDQLRTCLRPDSVMEFGFYCLSITNCFGVN